MKAFTIFGLLIAAALPVSGAQKSYQTGQLDSLSSSSRPVVTTVNGNTSSVNAVTNHVAIIAGNVEYFADFRSWHHAELIENSPIQFRTEKDTLWFIDQKGREFKCRIFKRRSVR